MRKGVRVDKLTSELSVRKSEHICVPIADELACKHASAVSSSTLVLELMQDQVLKVG